MVVSGLSDLLGYLLKPMGPYIPLMTLIVAVGGLIRGALWFMLRNKDSRKMRIVVASLSVFMLVFGLCNVVSLSADGVDHSFYDHTQVEDIDPSGYSLISRMLITRTMHTKDPGGNLAGYMTSMTAGLIGSAVLGIILLAADLFLSKTFLKDMRKGQIMQLLIAMIASGLVVTTLNTVLLRETIFVSWKVIPFSVIWIPRVVEEILGNTVKAYFVATLLGIFNKSSGLGGLAK